MSEIFYEVEDESKYHVKLKQVHNIEDVIGEFFSHEEIGEMMGMEGEAFFVNTYELIIKRNVVVELK